MCGYPGSELYAIFEYRLGLARSVRISDFRTPLTSNYPTLKARVLNYLRGKSTLNKSQFQFQLGMCELPAIATPKHKFEIKGYLPVLSDGFARSSGSVSACSAWGGAKSNWLDQRLIPKFRESGRLIICPRGSESRAQKCVGPRNRDS